MPMDRGIWSKLAGDAEEIEIKDRAGEILTGVIELRGEERVLGGQNVQGDGQLVGSNC